MVSHSLSYCSYSFSSCHQPIGPPMTLSGTNITTLHDVHDVKVAEGSVHDTKRNTFLLLLDYIEGPTNTSDLGVLGVNDFMNVCL